VFVKDHGSTNGTVINEELIQATEVQVDNGTSIRVGPLDFIIKIEQSLANVDGTPLPGDSPEAAAALAAVKAATATAANAAKAPARDTTPAPNKPTKPASKETIANTSGQTPSGDEDQDRIAAMLLGMDDEGNSSVPDGSTVMDMPSPLAAGADAAKKPEDGKNTQKKAQTREEMSDAANDLLRQYMRKPGKK
jgi:pSer/pThr/pTyr-binding forkhead associated (FHA) protein